MRADAEAANTRAGQASAGPWKHCGCGKCGLIWDATGEANVATSETDPIARAHDEWGDAPNLIYGRIGEAARQRNAVFISAARTDVPTLAAHVLALLEALKEVETRERERCCKDLCGYCAEGSKAERKPDVAERWIHPVPNSWCYAHEIRERVYQEEQQVEFSQLI